MINVLIFSRDTEWFGGVVNFVLLLKTNYSNEVLINDFKIGRRKGIMGLVTKPIQPLVDSIRLFLMLLFKRFDVYHLNPSLNTSSLIRDGLFILVLKLLGAKNIIISFHGWDFPVQEKISRSVILKKLFNWSFGNADITLVLAEEFKEWLVSIGFEDQAVRVFTTMFNGDQITNLKRTPLSSKEHVKLLFLSRFVREKGVFELLEAFRSVAMQYPNVTLAFAGTGPIEKEMKDWVTVEKLSDRVEFAGYVREKDKDRVLHDAHIFVLPTYYGEGCPVSLLEAMAAGMAVITTPVGGIPHVISEPSSGILLNGQVTAGAIQSAIESLLETPGRITENGEYNRKLAWERYNAPVVANYFENIYKEGCTRSA